MKINLACTQRPIFSLHIFTDFLTHRSLDEEVAVRDEPHMWLQGTLNAVMLGERNLFLHHSRTTGRNLLHYRRFAPFTGMCTKIRKAKSSNQKSRKNKRTFETTLFRMSLTTGESNTATKRGCVLFFPECSGLVNLATMRQFQSQAVYSHSGVIVSHRCTCSILSR